MLHRSVVSRCRGGAFRFDRCRVKMGRLISRQPEIMNIHRHSLTTCLYLLGLWLLAGCAPDDTELRLDTISGGTMGTTYSVQMVQLPVGLDTEVIKQRIDQILEQINDSMSTYRADSELSRFNRSKHTDWFEVSPALFSVLEKAQRISVATGGAFDVTVGPLVDLWGFGAVAMQHQVPPQHRIAERLASVGYGLLSLRPSPPAVRKKVPGVEVDLSAIAKGYAVDRLSAYLDRIGVENYLVEIGGELKARGLSARQRPWRVAVERPTGGARSVQTVVELNQAGLATSGDYRNYFERDGRRYAHTIDPTTGHPVSHNLASVTVMDDSTMRADAWATALLVLGPDAGFRQASGQGVAAMLITRVDTGFEIRTTGSFTHSLATE